MAGNPCNIIPDQEIVLEGGEKLVPAPGAADAGKVLGVINQEGGIGWVVDQGGTLVQQQANWAETNDQSVSFIQNKPTIPTVDQTYNASSANAQSGTAVAEALGSSSTLAAGNGVSLTESSGTLTVAADVDNVTIGFDSTTHKIKSLQTVEQTYDAASSNAQSGAAVAQAIASIPSSGAVPVLHNITCQENSVGIISGRLPSGEYLEPGLYQVFLKFSMSEYNSDYRHITFGYIVDGIDTIFGGIYYPVSIDSNGPFSNVNQSFMRTGYIQVGWPSEVNGIVVRFTNGTNSITGSRILNHLSLQYLKVADLDLS